jgi:hypothetical protein
MRLFWQRIELKTRFCFEPVRQVRAPVGGERVWDNLAMRTDQKPQNKNLQNIHFKKSIKSKSKRMANSIQSIS